MDARMVRRVLMIAYHYPPVRGSSGVHRTLKFSQYLPDFGWEPIVLTVNPRAYAQVSPDQIKDIPDSVRVYRAFGLDSRKHLSFRGFYPQFLGLPDRWVTWWLGAVPMGMRLIKQYRPDVIWATYPIATALMIGTALHRFSGLPLVADFRDTMVDEDYPAPGALRKAYEWVEASAVKRCTQAIFTTPSAVEFMRQKYPDLPESRWRLIQNGYDEENFREAAAQPVATRTGPLRFVHSGTLYPSERDPSAFFAALSQLKKVGDISASQLHVLLRATGHDDTMRALIDQHDIADIVTLEPPVPYSDALAEMLNADALLLLQASNCNRHIPAKLYEYVRARRPIFALTDHAGDTAEELRNAGITTIARLDSAADIAGLLIPFMTQLLEGTAPVPSDAVVASHSRKARTAELAALLDSVRAKESR